MPVVCRSKTTNGWTESIARFGILLMPIETVLSLISAVELELVRDVRMPLVRWASLWPMAASRVILLTRETFAVTER